MSGSTWVTADPHFGHRNILNFKREDGVTPLRDFPDIEAMDRALIDNWNGVVGEKDRVYLLGDVAFKPEIFRRVIPQLKGRIVLVPGNHEPTEMRRYADLFDDVRGYVCKKGFILSHIPIHPGSLARWSVNIHGHLHAYNVYLGTPQDNERYQKPEAVLDKRYQCVSVEQTNYTPILLDEVLKRVDL